MDKEKDFYNNDALEVVEYWQKNEDLRKNTLEKTADVFKMIFNNQEDRLNKERAVKLMSIEIVDAFQNYKSMNIFQENIKPLFEQFDKIENGSKLKSFLTKFKISACLASFKKSGNDDLKLLEDGKLSTIQINTIVNSLIPIKENIQKDEEANGILNKMLSNSKFKKEYEINNQREADIKEMKSALLDNEFSSWVAGMGNFYGIKNISKIPEGNDKFSIGYRENVMPEIDNMVDLLERINLSEDTNKYNRNMNPKYSQKFTIEEQDKIKELRSSLEEYINNKANYDLKNGVVNEIVINNKQINEVVKKELNSELDYKDDLKFLGLQYNNLNRSIEGYSIDRQIIDMTILQKQIERLPNKVNSDTDNLLISDLKSKINNNDYILLNDFNNTMKNIESLKSDGVLRNSKIDFNNISDFNKNYVERDLKSITEIVTRIENKHGVTGLPLFDEIDKFKFMEYKAISDSYKKYQSQELKTDIKNKF